MYEPFPQNLSILRRRAGYTQESLAEALGLSRQAVSKWESGQGLPEAATLLTLAELLNCSLDALMREPLNEECALPAPTPEQTRQAVYGAYHAHIGKFARSIALGVFLVLLGLSLTAFADARSLPDGASMAIFFLFLIGGVFLFVIAGIGHEDFLKNHPDIPLLYDQEEYLAFQKKFRLGVALSVAGLLADIALCAVLADAADSDLQEAYLGCAFLALLALFVTPLVYLGCLSGRYALEQRSQKQPDLSGGIMILATAAFLIWGLVWDGWRISWVCFLIGAALCVIADEIKKRT